MIMRDSDVRGAASGLGSRRSTPTILVLSRKWASGPAPSESTSLVINGELHGFELKSERDTLARLEDQAELYSQVFDRMTLIIAKRHLEKAVPKIPRWWGIIAAQFQGKAIVLAPIKEAKRNPRIEPLQLARLLWRPEALAILDRRRLSRGYRSRTANVIAMRLVEVLPLNELATEVREVLKRLTGWLGKPVGNKG